MNKHYINYKRGKKNLMSVIPKQSGLNIILNAKKESLYPNDKIEDVSYKGHLGNGDSLFRITAEDDIWQVLEYIEQLDQDSVVSEDIMSVSLEAIRNLTGDKLRKITKKAYKTTDGKRGYVFSYSKSYGQGNRKKYWYAYRRELVEKIRGCEEKYVVLGCGGISEILVVPTSFFEENLDRMNYSVDENNAPKYWHIVLFKSKEGRMTFLFSKPEVKEVEMDQYVVNTAAGKSSVPDNGDGKIQIKRISITDLDTDAIVNAANDGLWAGSGVCGAIFRAAGHDKLQAACNAIGHCDTGSAVITPGFDLKSKYIIHAVGPVWRGGDSNEPQLLYGAYKRSLELAAENNCHSIAFPLISAGIFGYPKDKAWRKAIQACKDFFGKNPDAGLQVVFAVLDDGIMDIGKKTLNEIAPEYKHTVQK